MYEGYDAKFQGRSMLKNSLFVFPEHCITRIGVGQSDPLLCTSTRKAT